MARQFHCEEDRIAADVVNIAYRVHTDLGPGLLESAYSQVFCHLLRKAGYKVETEKSVPIKYDGLLIGTAFKADVVINDLVIVELKAVQALEPVFFRQLLMYIRLAEKRLGLLVNFGAESMENQVKRVANGLPES